MSISFWIPVLALAGGPIAWGQSLKVYSEFQRVDPFGEVVAIDRAERHREILSPAVARNAHVSFHLAVTIPEGVPSFLYIQQNPERLNVTMYKEAFVRTKQGWIPDGLEKVEVPYFLILPGQSPIPKQNTLVFCMDVWVPSDTPVERVRLEAVLKSGEQWIVYPMELRVMAAVAPAIRWAPGPVPPLTARSDASLDGPLRTFLCGAGDKGSASALTLRQLIRRNVLKMWPWPGSWAPKRRYCAGLGPPGANCTARPPHKIRNGIYLFVVS